MTADLAGYVAALGRDVVILDTGCIEPATYSNSRGYAHVWKDGKPQYAHRVTYTALVGPVPDGLQLDHVCRHRPCCNVEHLEPVTPQENVRRGEGPAGIHSRVTHCPAGHPYEGDNLLIRKNGNRGCKECLRRQGREYARRTFVPKGPRRGWRVP